MMSVISVQGIRGRSGLVRIMGWIAALVLATFLAAQLLERAGQPTYDFHARFTAAHLLAEGQPIAKFYDEEWFSAQAKRFVPGMGEVYGANFPTTALIFSPLAFFEREVDARAVWTLLSIAALIALIEILTRIAGTDAIAKPYWYAAAFIAHPVEVNLMQGQSYILAALGLALALKWWQEDRQVRSGAVLAGLFAYKSTGVMFWALAAATGRGRLLLAGAGGLALIVAITWPFIGFQGWRAYFTALQDLSTSTQFRATAYQSVQGIVQHLLSSGGSFGLPILALPEALAQTLANSLAVAFIVITLYIGRRYRDDELGLGACLLAWLFVMPASQAHTYVIALIPIAQLFGRLRDDGPFWEKAVLWFGAAAIVLRTPYLSPRLFDGWAAIIAYPKLYGALLLWLLCILLMIQREQSAAVTKPSLAV